MKTIVTSTLALLTLGLLSMTVANAAPPKVTPKVIPPGQGIPQGGRVVVTQTFPGYPAYGRLERGDVLLEINGRPIRSQYDLTTTLNRSNGFARMLVLDVRTGNAVPVNLRLWGQPYKLGVATKVVQGPPPVFIQGVGRN